MALAGPSCERAVLACAMTPFSRYACTPHFPLDPPGCVLLYAVFVAPQPPGRGREHPYQEEGTMCDE